MSRLHETEAQRIIESAYSKRGGQGDGSENPIVLSCGGIFIPQPRNRPIQHQVLNTANEDTPSKVVSGMVPQNMLNLVMAKESMN